MPRISYWMSIVTIIPFLLARTFALLKLLDVDGQLPLLVPAENAKKDFVYLFQLPRSSMCACLGAMSLKTETWLQWNEIPFRRLSNQIFLGSATHGTAPFAQLNKEYIDGSDNIIEAVSQKFSIKYPVKEEHKEEEQRLRSEIDDVLYKTLIYDRTYYYKSQMKNGLDFLLSDQALIERLMPQLINNMDVDVSFDHKHFKIFLDDTVWSNYFQIRAEGDENEKLMFLNEHLKPMMTDGNGTNGDVHESFSLTDFTFFDLYILNFVILRTMKNIFKDQDKPLLIGLPDDQLEIFPSFEIRWLKMLEENEIELKDSSNLKKIKSKIREYRKGKMQIDRNNQEKQRHEKKDLNVVRYTDLKHTEIFAEFKLRLDDIVNRLEERQKMGQQFIFGDEPTPADASLFGILVQFFETPLNMPQMSAFFKTNGENEYNDAAQILMNYVKNIKESLGFSAGVESAESEFDGEGSAQNHLLNWSELKRRPWNLNYANPKQYGPKYKGPYIVDTKDLDKLLTRKLLVKTFNGRMGIDNEKLRGYHPAISHLVNQVIARANAEGNKTQQRKQKAKRWFSLIKQYLLGVDNGINKKTIEKKLKGKKKMKESIVGETAIQKTLKRALSLDEQELRKSTEKRQSFGDSSQQNEEMEHLEQDWTKVYNEILMKRAIDGEILKGKPNYVETGSSSHIFENDIELVTEENEPASFGEIEEEEQQPFLTRTDRHSTFVRRLESEESESSNFAVNKTITKLTNSSNKSLMKTLSFDNNLGKNLRRMLSDVSDGAQKSLQKMASFGSPLRQFLNGKNIGKASKSLKKAFKKRIEGTEGEYKFIHDCLVDAIEMQVDANVLFAIQASHEIYREGTRIGGFEDYAASSSSMGDEL